MTSVPRFSRFVKVETLPRDGLTQVVTADAAERAALAADFGLVDIAELKARFLIRRAGRGVQVTGEVEARITQTCVVTLEPFETQVKEPVDVRFEPPADERARREPPALSVGLEGEDEPDELVDGRIDLGALAAEFLALGLDPYPRKDGVEFDAPAVEGEDDSPFQSLAGLKGAGLD